MGIFLLILLNLYNFLYCYADVINSDMLNNNKINYTYVPIRESQFLTRQRMWPNFNGIGCGVRHDNYSYLFTTTQHESWNNKCSSPPRIVEVLKIDTSKKIEKKIVELHAYSGDCSDNINSTYYINSNLQLCNLKFNNS